MVYSWQNPDVKRQISHIELSKYPKFAHKYKVALHDDKGHSYSSKWMDEESLSKLELKESSKKIQLKEAFSNSSLQRVLIQIVRLLTKKLGVMYGNPEVYDEILKSDGVYYGFKYYIGANGADAIRFNVKKGNSSSNVNSIDFWFGFSNKPKFTLDTKGVNLVHLIDSIIKVVTTMQPVEELILSESIKKLNESTYPLDLTKNESTKLFNLYIKAIEKESNKKASTDFVNNKAHPSFKRTPLPLIYQFIKEKLPNEKIEESVKLNEAASTVPFDMKGLLKYIKQGTIYNWLSKQSPKDNNLDLLFRQKKITLLYKAYEEWCKGNGEQIYSNGNFRRLIILALDNSGMALVEKIEVEPGKPEKVIINKNDNDTFDGMMAQFELSPDEVFAQMEGYIQSIVKGIDYSLIVCGDPGIGKSFTVEKKLRELGLKELSSSEFNVMTMPEEDVNGVVKMKLIEPLDLGEKTFHMVKGKITSTAAYQLMYQLNGTIIVFDDSDSIFEGDGINLIKAATDDKLVRSVSMRTARTTSGKTGLPPSFDYVGKVIFITNMYASELDSAIKSRATIVNVDLKNEQIIDRIKTLLPILMKGYPGATEAVKLEVLEYLLEIKHLYKKIDFRTFQQAVKENLRGLPAWKKLVARSILLKNAQ